MKRAKNYNPALIIGASRVRGASRQPVRAPYNGRLIGHAPVADKKQIEKCIRAAVLGFENTRRQPTYKRRMLVARVAELLKKYEQELTVLLAEEAGKPVDLALGEVRRAQMTFTFAAAELTRFGGEWLPIDQEPRVENYRCLVERFPIGPIAAIAPYNWPINLVCHKLAPALAVGSSVVVKAPTQTPLSTFRLGEIILEAEPPEGALSIFYAPHRIAEKIVTDERIKMLSFTGSPEVGWELKGKCGKKKILLELGGNAAVAVHEDADLEWASSRIVLGGFGYAGQVCIKVQRVFVHQRIYEKFRALLAAKTRSCKTGDPMKKGIVCGPVIDAASAERIMAWIAEAKAQGAKVLVGGTRRGNVIAPTILENIKPSMKVSCQEVFGPVMTLESYRTWPEALKKVNHSRYGLQAGVFTQDVNRIREAFETLQVGGVIANDFPTLRVDNYPYGGVKDSGLGREGVKYTMDEMTEPRVLVTRFAAPK
jgi:acyl-CoA reductase-like NAD-dependent aldehyde dehydrogenase